MTEDEKATDEPKGGEGDNLDNSTASEHDPHFEPIISLPEVAVPTLEEDEDEMIQLRAKLYRFDTSSNPHEWKERGTGNVKLLRHNVTNSVRVVMRRDKTHKICANHFVTPLMSLSPNCGSDKAWVWSVPADLTYDKPSPELFAIRFATAEQAQLWKEKIEEAKDIVAKLCDFCKEKSEIEGEIEEESSDEEEEEQTSVSEQKDTGSDKETAKEEELTQKLKELEVSTTSTDGNSKPAVEAETAA